MFVFGCFRIPRNVAAGVAAGLVLLLAAPSCAPSGQDLPEPAFVDIDRVDSDSVGPVLVDTVPEPSPTAVSVSVSDSVTEPAGSVDRSGTVVAPVPVVTTTTTTLPTVEPTPITAPPPVKTPTTPTTPVEPTPVEPTTIVEPTTTDPPTTPEPTPTPTTPDPPTTPEPTPTPTTPDPPNAAVPEPTPTPVTWSAGVAPPGVSWFPGTYPVPGTYPPPDPGVTIVSITHRDAVWEYGVPEVTFRWTLHLSNGDNVERSWTPDPGYESTFWSPERIAAGTSFLYQEHWYWDSDPVYGPHPLQRAGHARHELRSITLQSALPASYTARTQPGRLPPSGYLNVSVTPYLTHLRQGPHANWDTLSLWSELSYALGSMSMQDQRALYETLLEIEDDGNVDPYNEQPNPRGDYMIEFLLTTQPRWSCPDPRTEPCYPPT